MPTPLEPLQGLLAQAFRRGAPVPDDPALAARCAEHVTGNDRLTPAEQVDIYRRQYWARHLGSLADNYPGLRAALGPEAFEALCRAYLEAHPPSAFLMRDLGAHLPAFADAYPAFPPGAEALARDLLRYEAAFLDIFDGAEPPPLDPRKVQDLPEDAWSTARIVLHPLLRPMRLAYPVQEIRAAARAGQPVTIPEPRPVHLLVFRKGLVIHWQEIDPLAFALIEALAAGRALVPACEELASGLDEAAVAALGEQVQAWFAQWTGWGIIVDIEQRG